MATKQSTIDFLTEQIQQAGEISSRKMFGEYALYCDQKVVGFVCNDQLFMKPTEIGFTFLDSSHEAPPYPGAKNYLLVPEERWDNSEWLTDFVRRTASVLPLPKPKLKRRIKQRDK